MHDMTKRVFSLPLPLYLYLPFPYFKWVFVNGVFIYKIYCYWFLVLQIFLSEIKRYTKKKKFMTVI